MGLMPCAAKRALVVDPALPDWLPELTVRNIRVGSARVALRARRCGSGTELDILDSGGIDIVRAPALSPGQDFLAAAFRTLL